MGCGNSRDVSSGILVNAPPKNTRLRVHTISGENGNRESRCGAARTQQAAVLLLTPQSAPGEGAPPSPPLSSAAGKAWRLTGCFFQGAKRITAPHSQLRLSFPNQQRELEKNAGSPYLIVRVWNRGRTLHLLTCSRSKERSSVAMQVVFRGDDPMHTMGQPAWLYYELRAAAGRRQDHLGRIQVAFRKGKFLAFPVVREYVKTRRPCKHKPRLQLHRKPLTQHSSRTHPIQKAARSNRCGSRSIIWRGLGGAGGTEEALSLRGASANLVLSRRHGEQRHPCNGSYLAADRQR